MKNINTLFKHKRFQVLASLAVLGLSIPILLITFFSVYYDDRLFPNISVSGIVVGGLKRDVAIRELIKAPLPVSLTLYIETNGEWTEYTVPISDIELQYHPEKAVDNAFAIGRDKKPIENFQTVVSLLSGARTDIPNEVEFNSAKLSDHLSVILGQVATEPVYPNIKVTAGGVIVNPGKAGEEASLPLLRETIAEHLHKKDYSAIRIPLRKIDPSLSNEEINLARQRAQAFLDKSINLEIADTNTTLEGEILVSFIDPKGGFATEAIQKKVQEIADLVDREPQNPTFVFENGKVTEFSASKNGIVVKNDELIALILLKLPELENTDIDELTISAPLVETESALATGDINDLGIKELVGKGTSRFRGSIAGRVHNVALAASRIHGTLIAPGETFSFNNSLGDVSKFTGYKEAYIIQDGKTVLGDGGGVCQVSTTLFRAVMNAGLPISERRGHSYRVGYYEQDSGPGLDATVYSPTTDFKFTNDTANHILIQAVTDTKNMTLAFELYGTNDGRVATVTKPVILSSTPPPEDLYVDDPNLPSGTVNQVEHKAWGAKVTFNYEVKRGENVIYQKTFLTNYKPWQAVFIRGTKPI